jgi:hypothetical protein
LEAAPCTGLVILAALARILSVGFLFCWQDGEKKDEAGTDAAKKGGGSDSDDDAEEAQQKKDGGVSNKQKKVCFFQSLPVYWILMTELGMILCLHYLTNCFWFAPFPDATEDENCRVEADMCQARRGWGKVPCIIVICSPEKFSVYTWLNLIPLIPPVFVHL